VPHAVAPDQVEHDGDRDEERDPQDQAQRDERLVELEDDHDERDQRDDQEPAQRRVHVAPVLPHQRPVR
jgi:hypothetical protein